MSDEELENVRKLHRDWIRNEKHYKRLMQYAEGNIAEQTEKHKGMQQHQHGPRLFLDVIMANLMYAICGKDWMLVAEAQVMLQQYADALDKEKK